MKMNIEIDFSKLDINKFILNMYDTLRTLFLFHAFIFDSLFKDKRKCFFSIFVNPITVFLIMMFINESIDCTNYISICLLIYFSVIHMSKRYIKIQLASYYIHPDFKAYKESLSYV